MSTKKQRRRERREKAREGRARKRSPVAWFMVSIAVALVAVGVAGFFLRSGDEPPFPGAVWSEAHGHWH